jgi:arginyl-tRNA synthetase
LHQTSLRRHFALTQFVPDGAVTGISSIGPFLNFVVDRKALLKEALGKVLSEKGKYGSSNVGDGSKVVIEFSSPNIAKPFHAGHLRTTMIGNFLKNLYKFQGYDVTALNYLGDWGKQYGVTW